MGVQGIKTGGLPKPLISYLPRDRVASVEMELEAYDRGDKTLLQQFIIMDPRNRSEGQSEKFLGDILALPYDKEMKEHYR